MANQSNNPDGNPLAPNQGPIWFGGILPDPNDTSAEDWRTIATDQDPDDDAAWENIDHLETSSGGTNWYEPMTRSTRFDKTGDPGRTIKLGPPWTRFRALYAEQGLPPLPRDPPTRPKRPIRQAVLSMIPCGIIDDGANHTHSQSLGWWIRSGNTAYCRIARRRHRGNYRTYYYHQYVAADGTQAPSGSIWFNRQFIQAGLDHYLEEAENRHRRWYNRARRHYFIALRQWQREQLEWEEEVFDLVNGLVDMPLTWSSLPYLYGDEIDQLSTLELETDSHPSGRQGGRPPRPRRPPSDGNEGDDERDNQTEGQQGDRGSGQQSSGTDRRSSTRSGTHASRQRLSSDIDIIDTEIRVRRRFHLPPTSMDPAVIQRVERWLEETNPRDPDRADAYLDVDSQGNPSIHSSDEDPEESAAGRTDEGAGAEQRPHPDEQGNQREQPERGQENPTGERRSKTPTPVLPGIDPRLVQMMHPLQRTMEERRQAEAQQRARQRDRMTQTSRITMDRTAIALARSRGGVIDRMTGRPVQPETPINPIRSRTPLRFTRGTGPTHQPTTLDDAPIQPPTMVISRLRLTRPRLSLVPSMTGRTTTESAPKRSKPNPATYQQGGPSEQPRISKRTRSDDDETATKSTAGRRRRMDKLSEDLTRQLNHTTEQARRYNEMERQPEPQSTVIQSDMTEQAQLKRRMEKQPEQRSTLVQSNETGSIGPTTTYAASVEPNIEEQLVMERSAWAQNEDNDLPLALEQSLLDLSHSGWEDDQRPEGRRTGSYDD
ncbi:MAG: RNA polymerase II elongation factor [Watsoniomyces obsoletus]|nr:MAG: RNA polymerase II elongation factor [Watsoniomyces obsoletus]